MKVAVIMGSASDEAKVEKGIAILKEYGVDVEVRALSAHRAHRALSEFVEECNNNGTDVILTVAGMVCRLTWCRCFYDSVTSYWYSNQRCKFRWNGCLIINCPDAFWYPSCNSCN